MAFWSKKKMIDSVNKYFLERNVSITNEFGLIGLELSFKDSGYSIYPYIKIDEDNEEISIMVNVREVTDSKQIEFAKLNSFNLNSKYFTAKYKDDAIILEYNTSANYDNVSKIIHNALESLFAFQTEIDSL